jgi:hypothetical protein
MVIIKFSYTCGLQQGNLKNIKVTIDRKIYPNGNDGCTVGYLPAHFYFLPNYPSFINHDIFFPRTCA